MRRAALVFAFSLTPLSLFAGDPVLPKGFRLEPFVSGLNYPTSIAFAPDGLLFACEKSGVVRVARNGSLKMTPFLDLSAEVNHFGDRGLTGIAVHPDFPDKPLLYLGYTFDPPGLPGAYGEADGDDGKGPRLSRVIVVEADPATQFETAIAGSAKVIFGVRGNLDTLLASMGKGESALCEENGSPVDDCVPSDSAAHGIGTVRFGPDGALYIGHGDASNPLAMDVRALRAQEPSSAAGKLFRIDPETGAGLPDNPFFKNETTANEAKVWAYGLRSPFRFSFHPVTGEVFIGDVGWNSFEEINRGRGRNFGWPCFEGMDRQPAFENFSGSEQACRALYEEASVTPPLYSYARPKKGGALILGDFYAGTSYPARYQNALFFGDFNDEWIRILYQEADGGWSAEPFAWSVGAVVQISAGADGDLYVLAIDRGTVSRLVYDGENSAPVVIADASPESGALPLEVRFSAVGTTDADGDLLLYEWSFGDGTSSSEANPIHLFEEAGVYEVVLTVSDANGARSVERITISAGVSIPSVTIASPLAGIQYSVGDGVEFSGRGVDGDASELPDARHQWEAILHHAGHQHPNWMSAIGKQGRLVIDDHGDDTSIELVLRVTDAHGTMASDRLMMLPKTRPLVIESEPAGMQIVYESSAQVAPFAATVPVGATRVVSAPAIQNHRSFVRWSDGGARSHEIRIIDAFQSLSAFYENSAPTARPSLRSGESNPLTLYFDGSASSDAEDETLSYSWSFGDGATSFEQSPSHTYPAPGRYIVRLSVSDALGATSHQWLPVRVGPGSRKRPVAR